METINKLSSKEKNLLYVLLVVLIFYGSYQLGFLKYTEKADNLNEENQILEVKLDDLEQKAANKEKYINETAEMNEEIGTMLNLFPTTLTQEKNTMFVINLESLAKMKISSISYSDNTIFYSTNNAETAENSIDTAAGGTENTAEASTSNEEIEGNLESNLDLTGYKTTLLLTYQANYAGLKSCIDYINGYQEKMNIVDLSAAFDNTTGNLTGTISIDVFALNGLGKEDEEVDIPVLNIGTDNIFGTFEIKTNDAIN